MRQLLSLITITALVAGCGSTEVRKDASAGAGPAQAPRAAAPAPAPSAATKVTAAPMAGNPLKDASNILSQRSVYFDFDESTIKGDYQKLLQAHAKYLSQERGAQARIEGNCDERGSREYNIALGQRRAQAAKNVMKVLGVDDARIETVSFGEERPLAPGHDESAWARNRRADIKYRGE